MQLIQYAPLTNQVHKRPLLILPPWINKFYVLDLRIKNSFVRWATEQGHTVFMVSWVNPDATFAQKTFDDYLLQGPLVALDAIEDELLREEELDRRFQARTGVTLDEFLDRVKDTISKNYLFPELAPKNIPAASTSPQNP